MADAVDGRSLVIVSTMNGRFAQSGLPLIGH
jgi:hypothetical protein